MWWVGGWVVEPRLGLGGGGKWEEKKEDSAGRREGTVGGEGGEE